MVLVPLFVAGIACTCTSGVHAAKTLKVPFNSHLTTLDPSSITGTANFASSANDDTSASTNNAVLKVVVPVQAGNAQTFNDVLIDTGSAILWVGGETPYQPGQNTRSNNQTFSVGYGAGGVNGTAYVDSVSIGAARVSSQIIGSQEWMSGFQLVKPIDGILGLGPSGSNKGEVSGAQTTPTFVENLVAEGSIDQPVFGIYVNGLDPTSGAPVGQGEITFGGVDESRIKGDVTWVDQVQPVDFHWEFNVSGLSWGSLTLSNETNVARTDTGVLNIGIPIDALFAIKDAVPGSYIVSSGSLGGSLGLPGNTSTSSLPPLSFALGGRSFSIPPAQYLVPRALYPSLNVTGDEGEGGTVYTWIVSAGFGGFAFGQKWLEGVYTAYDMAGHRVGFADLA